MPKRLSMSAVRLGLALHLLATPAAAQEEAGWVAPQDVGQMALQKEAKEEDAKEDERPEGWSFKVRVGNSAAYNHNADVVGNPDGSYFQFGLLLHNEANWRRDQHEWLSDLAIQHTQSKTPQLDDFVKTADALELRTLYLYHLKAVPWLGPYGRARLSTALFPGYYVSPDPKTIARSFQDGTTETEAVAAQEQVDLTGSFEPLLLRQGAGMFAIPVEEKALRLGFKLGAGFQEVFARDGFAVNDDEDTPEVELTQLQSFTEAGAEAEAEASGEVGQQVSWSIVLNLLYPLVSTAETDLEGTELLNAELAAKLSVKLNEWASLDYVLTVRRLPLIVDAVQVQNGLLFSTGFNLL